MLFLSAALASTSADAGEGSRLPFYAIMFALLVGVTLLVRKIFAGRAKGSVDAVASGALRIRIAPAPPFPEDVARLRALLADSSAEPRITRYTVPVVTADAQALVIADKKNGQIVSIPSADVTRVEARPASIKPKGTVRTLSYPSVWVTVAREGTELVVPLTPLVGTYDKVSEKDAEAIATELAARLGVVRG